MLLGLGCLPNGRNRLKIICRRTESTTVDCKSHGRLVGTTRRDYALAEIITFWYENQLERLIAVDKSN
jgi:hypothetical protein